MAALFTNRYLVAFAKTVLFFAITHLIILTYEALRGNILALNVFYIVGLDLVFPSLGRGVVNFILSYCMVLAAYGFFLYLTQAPKDGQP